MKVLASLTRTALLHYILVQIPLLILFISFGTDSFPGSKDTLGSVCVAFLVSAPLLSAAVDGLAVVAELAAGAVVKAARKILGRIGRAGEEVIVVD